MLTVNATPEHIAFEPGGGLLTSGHQPLAASDARYRLAYRLTPTDIEIVAGINVSGASGGQEGCKFILPVISAHTETVERLEPGAIRISKGKGRLLVRTDALGGVAPFAKAQKSNPGAGVEGLPVAEAARTVG